MEKDKNKIRIYDLRFHRTKYEYPLLDKVICSCGKMHSIFPKVKSISCLCGRNIDLDKIP